MKQKVQEPSVNDVLAIPMSTEADISNGNFYFSRVCDAYSQLSNMVTAGYSYSHDRVFEIEVDGKGHFIPTRREKTPADLLFVMEDSLNYISGILNDFHCSQMSKTHEIFALREALEQRLSEAEKAELGKRRMVYALLNS